MKIQYIFNGQVCISILGLPMPSGRPNEFMVTVQNESSGKSQTIYGMSEVGATDNAITFLRSLADDNSIVILGD